MCLVVAGLVLTTAAGGMAAYGQYMAGKSQDKYYNYLADQNDREADAAQKTAEQRVNIAQEEAAQRTKELKGDVSRTEGAQRAAMAASGMAGSVTAMDIISDTFDKSKLDEYNIRYNADITSWAARKEGADTYTALKNQGAAYRWAGKDARRAAAINMTSTILGTAASVAGGLSRFSPNQTGQVINTGNQNVAGRSFTTAWSPYKLT